MGHPVCTQGSLLRSCDVFLLQLIFFGIYFPTETFPSIVCYCPETFPLQACRRNSSLGECRSEENIGQNSPTVEFWQEKIEGNLKRANTEPSVDFRKANTEPYVHFRRANTETY